MVPPEDNYHVELSAFKTTSDMWHASLSHAGNDTFYSAVWVPVYPLKRVSEPKGERLKIILRFNNVMGEAELEKLLEEATITGVVNPKGCLPSEAADILEEGYPGLDCENCYVIGVNQPVPSKARALGFFAGGMACISVFGGWMFWAFKDSGRTKYGGDAKVDTSAPDFMTKRLSTDIDPERFMQTEMMKRAPDAENECDAGFGEEEELAPMSFKDEDLAYRKEFAEKYGLSGFADESQPGEASPGENPGNSRDGRLLNY